LTVTKFDRFARNMAEANQILTDLSDRGVLFGLGASVYDWNDPFGRLFLQTLAMVAEFEANLGHLRTREGMALAKRQGKLKGKQPKLPESAQRSIRRRYATGEVSIADLGRRVQRRPLLRPSRPGRAEILAGCGRL
jgi:DNA invertase Pin-like site-specific DNA recombinase